MKKRSLFLFLMLALLSGSAWAQETIYTSYTFINGTDTGNDHPSNLVDNDKNSRWLVSQQSTFASSPAYCQFHSAEPITPVGYVITSGTDSQANSRRNPKSWRIEASTDNYNWVTLVTFTDFDNILEGDMEDVDFSFEEPNTTAYQYFKFVVTDIQGTEPESDGCWAMQLNEFQFKVVPNSGIASLTVCDDTEIIINSNIPMCGIYFDEYTKSECIIPASELTDMTRGIITAITFYPSSVNTTNLTWENTHQTVFIKEVSGTTLDESYSGMSGATTVKQGSPLPMPAEGASYTITFDTPYTYHGGNLLIGVYNDKKGSYNNVIWRGTNSSYGVSAYGSSSSSLEGVNYSAQDFLPKTTFTYIPPKPLRTSDNVFLTWEEFAASVTEGNTYEGKTVYLETDINTPVTAMVGTNDAPFKGTFDGTGHTLTVNYTSTAGRCAVFNTVDNASFMNLNLAGTMSVGHFPSGSLIGYVLNGCHITNCVSAVEITATHPDAGDWGVGGFLGEADRNSRPSIFFEGCAFTGKFIGTCNGWGGFVGRNRGFVNWSLISSSVYINNCVFAPSAIPTTTEGCATFGRSDDYTNSGYSYVITNNSYFTQALGVVQGKERHTVTGDTGVTVTLNGTDISHDLSNITGYGSSTDNGITYNGTIWAGNEDIVSLNLSGAFQYEADHGTLTQSGNNWTLAMEDNHNTVISAINSPVTLTKTIEPYVNSQGGKGGYYLIASPLAADVNPTTVGGMITADEGEGENVVLTYDFYRFDQSEESEWRNYRADAFNLVNGQGYLYASKNGTTLTFTGIPYSGNGQVGLVYDNNAQGFKGWNLVGNPFAQAAYADRDYYALQNGSGLIPTSSATAIGAMEGIFVTAADANDASMTFSTTQPGQKSANLALNITSSNKFVDRAIVRFGEGRQLPKFQLNPNHTKVCFPQEGEDYAIVNAEEMGEMPVSFKAEKNGSYTLSFNTEDVSFAYLHLIDNMTGNDVDLLSPQNVIAGEDPQSPAPTYTFYAKTTDYESRFKLVFATICEDADGDNEVFAFYSDGNLIVNGEGTLQVIDMLGRQMFSRDIHSSFIIHHSAFPTGVYVLRLVNGENVKVQKVVVR